MGINHHPWNIEGIAKDHIRGFATHAGQGEQRVVVFGYSTAVEVDDPLRRGHDVFGFGAKQTDRLDEWLDLLWSGLGQSCCVGIGSK